MKIIPNISLKKYNTFAIDVNARYFAEYQSVEELKLFLQNGFSAFGNMLHIGGGSNLLFLADYDGIILHSAIKGIEIMNETADSVSVKVGAGVVWDDFVQYCVENGWYGVENLSHIPGETGASAVQNIGAYGVEVKDLIESVQTVEIETAVEKIFSNNECGYDYRQSVFKSFLKGRYIVTSVVFSLYKVPQFSLSYQHLEDEVLRKGELTLSNVRQTIVDVRRSKLPDPEVLGNAGSFFMNPVIDKDLLNSLLEKYPETPHYLVSDTLVKIPAAWLIDRCGWKGRRVGNVGVHEKQALVIVNYGGATGSEIAAMSEQIRADVQSQFGIELIPEVNFVC
ncbi:MAG: UDP-N-acetylmuramate dehydrogenase [Paludibacteraceae bacterium]|nr:UDP-N-acetylmuramate dehydrogenase [Paludibacteraceae bacterium]